jgi:transcription-repair coupling factor (superfamily II helicase)
VPIGTVSHSSTSCAAASAIGSPRLRLSADSAGADAVAGGARRLAAIREFSDLGSGFRIAALDLEIRGAGNLLGGEQSGHIEAVGFDMYMKLLEDTIRELKGEDLEDERRATVNLKIDLRVDEQYIPDMNQRLAAYRRMASARAQPEVDRLLEELQDRYGPLSPSLVNLAAHTRSRVKAERIGIESVERDGQTVVLKFRQDAKVDPNLLLKMIRSRKDLTLLPPAVLRMALEAKQAAPASILQKTGELLDLLSQSLVAG